MISKETVFGGGGATILFDVLLNAGDGLLLLADVVFVPLSVAFGSIVPHVGWLDQDALQPLIVFIAALYVTNLLIERTQRFRNDDDN
ncbi:hypothetical protein [Halobellus rarus]|uniref:Uncharacterized protein n=1 Tax=Halobellus rarus TaxID=1126237 RepID=A0ABD6CNP9_9EURY|nr:hypothetical protein [Halobellus rarus]